MFHISYMRCFIYAYRIRSHFFSRLNAFSLLSTYLLTLFTAYLLFLLLLLLLLLKQHKFYNINISLISHFFMFSHLIHFTVSFTAQKDQHTQFCYIQCFFCSITLNSTGFCDASCTVLFFICVQSL